MALDYSKYSVQAHEEKAKEWKPPFSDSLMFDASHKLALSTRVFPEYMLACYAFLTEQRGVKDISSMSDLMYKIVCDYINSHSDEIGELPDADTALDFLIMQGWVSTDSKENFRSISTIREKQMKLQERVDSGNASMKERYEYWKNRDPEKAEALLEEMSNMLASGLSEDTTDQSQSVAQRKQSEEPEKVTFDNFTKPTPDEAKPTPDFLDSIPDVPEEPKHEWTEETAQK